MHTYKDHIAMYACLGIRIQAARSDISSGPVITCRTTVALTDQVAMYVICLDTVMRDNHFSND